MQLRCDQLHAHLSAGMKPIYTVHGDEVLLVQEAADTIRRAAHQAGYTERQVHTVAGLHFDWSGLLGAAQALSLFAPRQFIEIRIPSGKPGKEGSEALQRYCTRLGDEVITLVTLPRLDRAQLQSAWFQALEHAGAALKIESVEREALPAWLTQRLAAQGLQLEAGQAGEQALAFFADHMEGNLLAAHQEVEKLALLYPPGILTRSQIEAAISHVARYDAFKLTQAVWAGQLGRVLRMLDGLQAEGESAVWVHWALAEDIRALLRVKAAQDQGVSLSMAMKAQRIWGIKERLFERVAPLVRTQVVGHLLEAAQVCDGVIKGLPHPQWPRHPWEALRRLAMMMVSLAQGPQQPTPRWLLRARLPGM